MGSPFARWLLAVRFIPAKGLPMHHALLSFVVALGLIAGQDPLLQLLERLPRRDCDSRGASCWSASRGAIDIATNLTGACGRGVGLRE